MTLGLASSSPTAADPAIVAAHLEHVIESQPCCLMRVDLDGLLLAANTAALRLLGTDDHAQVLGRLLTEHIAGAHHQQWRAFLARTWNEESGSLECELVDLDGTRRIALVQAVAQRSSLDSVSSLVLAVQDVSARRRLETALEEQQAKARHDDTQAERLREGERARQLLADLESRLADAVAERARVERDWTNAAAKIEEIVKSAAADRVELEQIIDHKIRHLEPLAAAGRVATSAARDLQAIVEEIEERLRRMLTDGALEGTSRENVEALRRSAMEAASLVRQMTQGTGKITS